MEINKYKDSNEALRALSKQLAGLVYGKKDTVFNLALSGGETAKQLFSLWVKEYATAIDWETIRFYWVDERCVPKNDPESNYGNAARLLFKPLGIPKEQIHRIKGENYPPVEAKRYSTKVSENVSILNHLPHFDCIILGVGNDAHTASIFPTTMNLLTDKQPFSVSEHPQTKQKRITMTGSLILNDTPLLVPVLGKGKEEVIQKLKNGYTELLPTPATYILSKAKEATVFITEE